MTRRDIEFDAEGVTLRGWFYPAEGSRRLRSRRSSWRTASRRSRRCTWTSFAEVFAAAGLNALVFDNRNFGASDGDAPPGDRPVGAGPRLPARHHLRAPPCPRPTPAGSGSGAAATPAATSWSSRRSTAGSRPSSAQVPLISGYDNVRALVRSDFIAGFREHVRGRPAGPLPGRAAGAWSRWWPRTRSAPSALPHPGLLAVVHRDR